MTRHHLLAGLVVFLVGLLLGFIPQRIETGQLRSELRARDARAATLELELEMAELRDVAGLMLLETLRRNYGLALNHSTRYFESLRRAIARVDDDGRRAELESLFARRDQITAVLAQSDPASDREVQGLYAETYQATGSR